jgi:hypothetical protein
MPEKEMFAIIAYRPLAQLLMRDKRSFQEIPLRLDFLPTQTSIPKSKALDLLESLLFFHPPLVAQEV